jgi:hypothetical protein
MFDMTNPEIMKQLSTVFWAGFFFGIGLAWIIVLGVDLGKRWLA